MQGRLVLLGSNLGADGPVWVVVRTGVQGQGHRPEVPAGAPSPRLKRQHSPVHFLPVCHLFSPPRLRRLATDCASPVAASRATPVSSFFTASPGPSTAFSMPSHCPLQAIPSLPADGATSLTGIALSIRQGEENLSLLLKQMEVGAMETSLESKLHHQVRDPIDVDYNPTRWPQSPRVVMRCAPRASNGPNRLGLFALQMATEVAEVNRVDENKVALRHCLCLVCSTAYRGCKALPLPCVSAAFRG